MRDINGGEEENKKMEYLNEADVDWWGIDDEAYEEEE